jgi:hypothetical protein
VAALLAGVLDLVVSGLAAQALEPGEPMPTDIGGKLGLAAVAVGEFMGRMAQSVSSHQSALTALLGVLAVGAGVGALYYLHRVGLLSRARRSTRSNRKRRRE